MHLLVNLKFGHSSPSGYTKFADLVLFLFFFLVVKFVFRYSDFCGPYLISECSLMEKERSTGTKLHLDKRSAYGFWGAAVQ